MTAEQLKNSILQLAMQGKLVEQRPEEGTGEELYKEIQTEKKRQIKDGKNKKGKELPPISEDDILFDIPDSWKWVRLGEVTELIMGQSPKGDKVFDGGNGIEFHQGKIYFSADYLLESTQTTTAPTKTVEPNTVLLCVRAPVGIANITPRRICIGRGLCGVKVLGEMEPYFMLNWLRAVKNSLVKKATGTTFVAITGKVVEEELIPLPPLAEQKRIVAKIEELMPFVEQYAAASTKLNTLNTSFPDQMKKSILQEAVQGKLVPQDPNDEPASMLLKIEEEKKRLIKEGKIKKQKPLPEITEDELPFDIPDSWEWVKLGNIIDLLSGTDFKPSEYSDISGKTVYITGASCLTDRGVISQRWTDTPRNIASKGDLLIVCKGSGYGKTVICDVDEAHIARQIMAIKDWGLLDLNYVRLFLQSRMTYIKQSGQGVIPGIDRGTILNMVFPLPPLSEQRRIVSFTSNVLETVEALVNDLE